MIVRRALLGPLLLIAAVLGQLAVVNRLPLPGRGATPDLVLLVVAALGVCAGPMPGLLAGFAGGLAIDIAPPGGHLAGEYALIYCLVGYACGRIRDEVQGASSERSVTMTLTVMAAGVAAGEAGKAGLGMMLSDPNTTGPAIRHILPAAIVYDLLLCPFVLWLVSVAVAYPVSEHAPEPRGTRVAPAFRLASAGAAPGLRLAGTSAPLVPPPVRSEPRLRLAGSRSPSLSITNSAFAPTPHALPGGRPVRVNFGATGRGNQLGGSSALRAPRTASFQGRSPGKGWLQPARPGAPATRRPSAPGKGWLQPTRAGAPGTRRPSAPGKGWARGGMPAAPVRRPGSPGKGWLQSARPGKPAPGSRRPSTPGKGWARGDMSAVPVRRPGSPGKGWIRAQALGATSIGTWRRRSPGSGWLSPARPGVITPWRRNSPGNGWLKPVKPPRAPRLKSPARGWARGDILAVPAWRPGSPGKGWIRAARTTAPAGANGWRRRSPGSGWLSPARPGAVSAWRRKSPGSGWLKTAKPPPAPRVKSPGRGWLRPARPAPAPRRKSPSRGWVHASKPPKQNWYTRSPSTRWLRRGRRRRLLLGGRR